MSLNEIFCTILYRYQLEAIDYKKCRINKIHMYAIYVSKFTGVMSNAKADGGLR